MGGSMTEKHETHTDKAPEAPVQAAPAPAPAPVAAPQGQSNGLAIAAMVVGIVALLGGLLPFWGFCLGVVAVILGIVGLKKPAMKGMSITGIVTGGIAVLWSVFVTLAFIALLFTGAAVGNQVVEEANKIDAESQSLVDSKKDFTAGQTAVFGDTLEVKINDVQRNYVPENAYSRAAEGKEFVVLNITVKNVGEEIEYISSSSFDVNENGVAVSATYRTVEPDLGYGDVSPGASKTGNVVYEVTKGATGLKLQYTTTTYSIQDGAKKLVYTLAF